MIIGDYLKTYYGMKRENLFHRLTLLLLSVTIMILTIFLLRRDTVMVITPYTLSSEAWVSSSEGSQSYKEAWALFFAQELGNITPANVDFVKDRIVNLIAPSIFKSFMDVLNQQAMQIKEDRLVLRFEPGSVEYEPETDKIFVSGRLYTKAFNEKETSQLRTFEFRIRLSSYAPELVWMDVYSDPPHTLKFLKNQRGRSPKQEK